MSGDEFVRISTAHLKDLRNLAQLHLDNPDGVRLHPEDRATIEAAVSMADAALTDTDDEGDS